MFELTKRFSFGLNLDDSWRYAGFAEPKSIIIPHVLSLSLPEGRKLDELDEAELKSHGERDPRSESGRAVVALADILQDIKVDFVRCWFPWRFFEPKPVEKGQLDSLLETSYQSWPMDNLVNTLYERGIGVVPVVACGYRWMLPGGLTPDRDALTYVRRAVVHARLLVRRYRDKVKFWQIENEPDWWAEHEAGGWRSGASWLDPHGFRDGLLRDLNEAVHEEDHTAMTIINLEADTAKVDPAEFASNCDILGLDFYPNYKSAAPIDLSVFRRVETYRKTGKPVIISETGYPSGPSLLDYSPGKQAEYVEGACREAHSLDCGAVGIWRYIDTSYHSFPEQENHFGLIDSRGRAKPGLKAFAEVIQSLR